MIDSTDTTQGRFLATILSKTESYCTGCQLGGYDKCSKACQICSVSDVIRGAKGQGQDDEYCTYPDCPHEQEMIDEACDDCDKKCDPENCDLKAQAYKDGFKDGSTKIVN